jgi:hypothetical protein
VDSLVVYNPHPIEESAEIPRSSKLYCALGANEGDALTVAPEESSNALAAGAQNQSALLLPLEMSAIKQRAPDQMKERRKKNMSMPSTSTLQRPFSAPKF